MVPSPFCFYTNPTTVVLPRFKYGAVWSGNPLSFLLSFPLESLSTLQNLQKSHPPPRNWNIKINILAKKKLAVLQQISTPRKMSKCPSVRPSFLFCANLCLRSSLSLWGIFLSLSKSQPLCRAARPAFVLSIFCFFMQLEEFCFFWLKETSSEMLRYPSPHLPYRLRRIADCCVKKITKKSIVSLSSLFLIAFWVFCL